VLLIPHLIVKSTISSCKISVTAFLDSITSLPHRLCTTWLYTSWVKYELELALIPIIGDKAKSWLGNKLCLRALHDSVLFDIGRDFNPETTTNISTKNNQHNHNWDASVPDTSLDSSFRHYFSYFQALWFLGSTVIASVWPSLFNMVSTSYTQNYSVCMQTLACVYSEE